MLEMLVNKKLLFVLMGIFAGVGVVDKCIVSMGLKRLVQAAGDMSKSTHPLMRLVRAKFEHACMVSDTVENVGVFVDKYLYEYKICGLPLHTVRRMEKMCAGLCALTGLTGALLTYRMYGMGDAVLRMGTSGVGLGILVWLFHLTTDEEYCVQMAKNYMVDYLENVCLHKYEKANGKVGGKVGGKERTGRLRITGSDAVRQMQNTESDMECDGEYEATTMPDAVETMASVNPVTSVDTMASVNPVTPVNTMPSVNSVTPMKTMAPTDNMAQEDMAPAESGRKETRTRSGRRRSEPTREVARNLEKATEKLAEVTAQSQAKTAAQDQTKVTAQSIDEEEASKIPEEIRKELPKEEMIRQILQEFMA